MTHHYTPDFAAICGISNNIEEYGRFQQHLGLVEDVVRVGQYFAAIKASARADRKVAVDVGGGSGVLTLCALKNGYEKVYYVEPSKKIAHYAAHNFEQNGVRDRVVIINSVLEAIPLETFLEPIDLIVHETISTFFLGFGCWPAFDALRKKLSPHGTIVPFTGKVFGVFTDRDWSMRNEQNGGLAFLAAQGIHIDLYRRAFRSGGNVFDKANANYMLADAKPIVLAEMDARAENYCVPKRSSVTMTRAGRVAGLVTYWTIGLSEHNAAIKIDSRDPAMTAWNPYYLAFNEPYAFLPSAPVAVELKLFACDAPYPFAFELHMNDEPVTQRLYW